MKNTHIPNLLQEVPKDIRLEVYKEALDIISTKIHHDSMCGFSLCLLLPCLLWDLDNYLAIAPNNEDWDWKDTGIAFPEFTKEIYKELISLDYPVIMERRIRFLQDSIKLLS